MLVMHITIIIIICDNALKMMPIVPSPAIFYDRKRP
jgi:hypothetical protein